MITQDDFDHLMVDFNARTYNPTLQPLGPGMTPLHPLSLLDRALTDDEMRTVLDWEGCFGVQDKDREAARALADKGYALLHANGDIVKA
jgi:hypothetical protein